MMKLKYLIFLILLLRRVSAINNKTFPKNFLFGVATASYQIEGAWNTDGKGENIWDRLTHTHPEYIKDRSNGDIACNSYNKYEEDVQLIKNLGVNFYRFSISWSRILPTGFSNKINQKGIDYYKNLIKKLKENGIEPLVTLYHWDLPQTLQDIGGWTNPALIKYFTEYANVVFKYFDDDVRYWTTFNEPKLICQAPYDGKNSMAPALDSTGIGDYLCSHTLIKAHAKVYHLYKENYNHKGDGLMSIVIDTTWYEAGSENKEDIEAQDRQLQFFFGLYANPIFNGDYPKVVIDRVELRSKEEGFPRSRLPKFTPEEVDYIKNTYDYLALNTYTTNLVKDDQEAVFGAPSLTKDIRAKLYVNESWPGGASSWLKVYPEGFRNLLVWIKNTYNNPDIIVTENGFSDRGELEDTGRIDYYTKYLSALLDAYYEDNVNIIGYAAWSLFDNFEWMMGYTEKFGLYYVNFTDPERTRTAKKSAEFFKNVIQTKCLVDECVVVV